MLAVWAALVVQQFGLVVLFQDPGASFNRHGFNGPESCLVPVPREGMNLPGPSAVSGSSGEYLPSFTPQNWIKGMVASWATSGLLPDRSDNPPQLSPVLEGQLVVEYGTPRRAFKLSSRSQGIWAFGAPSHDGSITALLQSDLLNIFDLHLSGSSTMQCGVVMFPTFLSGTWTPVDLCWTAHQRSQNWQVGGGPYIMTVGSPYSEYAIASANAYRHVSEAQKYCSQVYTDWQPPVTSAFTNYESLHCNAVVFEGSSYIMFAASGAGCANAAYSTVARHEYGHVFLETFHPVADFGWPRFRDVDFGAFHEGSSDTLAALSLGTPCMGKDFFGPGTGCGRDLEQLMVHPVDNPDAHIRGMALSGAFWDLYKSLKSSDGESGKSIAQVLFLESVRRTTTYMSPDTRLLDDVLAVDSERYGGEHQLQILNAFIPHGFH